MKKNFLRNASYGLGLARVLNFTTQSLLLPLIDQIISGNDRRSISKFGEHMKTARPKLESLLLKDSENIANSFYPISVLFQESPLDHYFRLPFLIGDAIRAGKQRKNKETANFDQADLEYVNQAPEYYKRNFHFQNGGYLNDSSAALYDHQVEILFSGTAQVMRRQIIPNLKKHFNMSDGEGLKFLEIGSGTGALTRSIALAFPKAQITCLEISPHYLQYSQERLAHFRRISYVQGIGENLDFKNESYDAVFSCYLFHELPKEIREKVVSEKLRVLKPGGFVGIVDSIQKGDDPDLDWALKQFPIDFHEPFYKNYSESPLEDLLREKATTEVTSEVHFLTKIVCGKK